MSARDPAAPLSSAPSFRAPASRLLSRRQLLQGAAGLGALVVLGALPADAEGATLPALTAAQLTAAMASLPKAGSLRLPGGGTAQVADLRAAAAAFAVGDASSPNPLTNPVAALGVLVALAAWAEHNGTLDLSVALPKAPVRPLRLALPRLPNGASTEPVGSAIPPALVVRPNASLVLVGTLSGHRVLAALEDPVRQVAGHPRLELVLLRSVDLAALLAVLRAKLDATGTVVLLASGSRVPLRPVQSALAVRLAHAAGVRFVDQAPIQPVGATTPLLTVEPIVPAPDPSTVAGVARVSQAKDGRVLAYNGSGKAVGRAADLGGQWQWVTPDAAAGLDYFLRELGERVGLRFGTTVNGADPWTDPRYSARAREFNLLAPIGNGLVPEMDHYAQWNYDTFGPIAAQYGMPLRLYNMFWPWGDFNSPAAKNLYPQLWVGAPAWGEPASAAYQATVGAFMDARIRYVLTHYPAVAELGVANEAYFWYEGQAGINDGPYFRAFGADWVSEAFIRTYRIARALGRTPGEDLTLFYGDALYEVPGPFADFVYGQLQAQRARVMTTLGLTQSPFVVDMQLHVDLDVPPALGQLARSQVTTAALVENVRRFSALGEVWYGEFSVHGGTRDQRTSVVTDVVQAALQLPGVLTSILFWELMSPHGLYANGDLLFDANNGFVKTPTYDALVALLRAAA